MSHYSIKDLENLTGIKAHTIRMWEQRYNILKPDRTDTNIRLYDADELKLMLNVALLNSHGYKISKIAQMTRQELHERVMGAVSQVNGYYDQINALTVAMIDLNEEHFNSIMLRNIDEFGFEATITHVVYPFLSRVGTLWATNAISPAHEHFITNLIRQKIIAAIDMEQSKPSVNSKKFMLFLPEGELHEIGLLFAYYVLKARGHRVIYLGQSLPLGEIKAVYNVYSPEYIFTIITSNPGTEYVQDYVNDLCVTFPQSKFWLTGIQIVGQDIEMPENAQTIMNINNFIDMANQAL